MTQSLKVYKLNALPSVYEASSLYFVKNQGTQTFDAFLTSNDAQVLFRSMNVTDIESTINDLKGVANGLLGLNADGIVPGIDGQNTSLKSADQYVWDDLVQPFVVRSTTGVNNPSTGSWSDNMQGLLFSGSTMNQVWADYHITHTYAMGTNVFPHIHWLPTTTATGTVRWGVEYRYAKGHGQQAFTAPVTFYIEHNIASASFEKHMVSEATDLQAFGAGVLEPDAVIKIRFFRDAGHANDTYPDDVHAWQGDLHYQIGQLGTRNKEPDFFVLP